MRRARSLDRGGDAQGFVAIDTETDCIDCIIAKLAGISLATRRTGLLYSRRPQRRDL